MAEPVLSYRGVTRTFQSRGQSVPALNDFTVDVVPGEFLTVVGPSGCGKSTLLNLTVGLLQPTRGEVLYKGAATQGINTNIGYVTQEDNLYPWRTLQANVEFGMEVRGTSKGQRQAVAGQLIGRVGLTGFEDRYRHELSGGMRQRGHIARTLAYEPDVILMDEPFGPLDVQTRLQSQELLLELWAERDTTIVFITHDLTEAVSLSDRVIVLSKRPGTIKEIFDVPLSRPRDIFSLPTSDDFREVYDPLWDLLQAEMRESKKAV